MVIATDDERIRAAAEKFSAKVVMTRADHLSGTDRVAEAASASNAQIIVNIQGDEPMIDPAAIDAACSGFWSRDEAPMSTLKTRIFRAAGHRRSQCGESGHGRGGQRDLFFAVRHSLCSRGRRRRRRTSNTSDCMFTAAISCWPIRTCR